MARTTTPTTRADDWPYLAAPPLALAHRGGAAWGPNRGIENSLAAFRAAVGLGYRYVETDVHVTADGHLVAFHDDVLDRVTDGHGRLSRLPWSAVRTARIDGREPVPRFAELLEELPTTRLNVDLKSAGAARPLWETIRSHGAEDRVLVASFSDERLAEFRRLSGGRVATAAGPREVALLRFAPLPVLRRAASSLPGIALQVPEVHHLGGVPVRVVTPGLVERAHALGKQVHVWTVDDAADMTRLLDLGVDGLVSDRVDTLQDVLLARGQWR
ncbi:glycerophosphodiester phosphodiesterase [Lapillicoccus jejuensis]|uniref:Glycerophosphoryl diester phosphodiesterase n=1 Tax=Lapillicoccus jejuensis TaxID=402171 RepID=A0A542DVJ2_9MICO|nr:glycerophosphodiester phosphodiesterase [Lapillicoccus jejuensis]TQJ07112.1 glycerophosphoryl diester phosphodiesterase [Lapillicoccus jejuensis]